MAKNGFVRVMDKNDATFIKAWHSSIIRKPLGRGCDATNGFTAIRINRQTERPIVRVSSQFGLTRP